MNRSKRFAFIFCVVLCIIVVLLILFTGKKEESNEKTTQNDIFINEQQDVMYEEGDEDAAYNYIKNPDVLKNTEMPYVACLSLNDEIDKYLRKYNYISEILTIENAYEKGTKIHFDILIGDTNSYLEVEYDIRYNEYEINFK